MTYSAVAAPRFPSAPLDDAATMASSEEPIRTGAALVDSVWYPTEPPDSSGAPGMIDDVGVERIVILSLQRVRTPAW